MNVFYANGSGKWLDRSLWDKPNSQWSTIGFDDFQDGWNDIILKENNPNSNAQPPANPHPLFPTGIWGNFDKQYN